MSKDNEIYLLADHFLENANKYLDKYPRFRLDGTWQSISTCHYFLQDYKGQKTTQEDQKFINSIIAYIAFCLEGILLNFLVPESVSIKYKDEKVLLTISGEPFFNKGEQYQVNLTELVNYLLQHSEPDFQLLENFSMPILPETNLIAPTCLGILLGMSPYGRYIWNEKGRNSNAEFSTPSIISIAKSSAEHYSKVFPLETWGADFEIYLNRLIYPPFQLSEKYPGINASEELLDYFLKKDVSLAEINQLAYNLSLTVDPQISDIGYILLHATVDPITQEYLHFKSLVPLSHSKDYKNFTLKPAIINCRATLGKPQGFLSLISEGRIEDAQKYLAYELACGFLPDIFMPISAIDNPSYIPILQALSWNKKDIAKNLCTNLITELHSENKCDIVCLILQASYLELTSLKDQFLQSSNNFNDLLTSLKAVGILIQSPIIQDNLQNPVYSPFIYELMGMLEYSTSKMLTIYPVGSHDTPENREETALMYYQKALGLYQFQSPEAQRVCQKTVSILYSKQNYLQALKILKEYCQSPVTSLANHIHKFFVLKKLEREEDAFEQISYISKVTAINEFIFDLLVSESLLKSFEEQINHEPNL